MAPENIDSPFASPFAAGSPFTASQADEPQQDTDVTDEVDAIDGDEDVTTPAAPGAAFGLVFQAADPQTRAPKRTRRQDERSEERDDSSDETNDRRSRSKNSTREESSTRTDATQGGVAASDDEHTDSDDDGRPARSRQRRRRDDASDGSESQAGGRRKRGGNSAAADDSSDGRGSNDSDGHDSDDEQAGHDDDSRDSVNTDDAHDSDEQTPRRRRRGGRGRRNSKGDDTSSSDSSNDSREDDDDNASGDTAKDSRDSDGDDAASRKRTRRRRRSGSSGQGNDGDDPNTVTKVREPRRAKDEITSIKGSVRLEAKKQRRREGREAGRRRTVITEAEFLARRESVERVMVVREQEGRTQIGVLEDGVLAEHYVSRQEQASSMAGNVYLGRVQNVLPSMEAAFVDIGRGRNAVLYAGEVNWDAAGLDNQPKRIEHALKAGESVLVQVTKDPIGHKGARLTSQISLPGRFVVFVPGNSMTGISRKLPDTERSRLKRILKEVVPADAGVIVRTAAEGASEEELRADVERLMKMWERIQSKAKTANAPSLLHGEPDLTVRVIRDVFNEDFAKMVVSGERAWNEVHTYISEVAPDLVERLEKWDGDGDVFAGHRIDEQLAKAMDRKVWLPSGGSLVIDRTEAMTVVDVNTGKFVGSGGNLEETVTKNNIEAAEEIVRQLRLRDIGGIIVVDFIDMVLEANRELVVRRLLECLGRDRTKHQVAEVTSLGLVQMTRKRVGAGLVEVFSETCESCQGRGIVIHDHPVENRDINGNDTNRKGRGGRGRGGRDGGSNTGHQNASNGADRAEESSTEKAERDNGFAQIAAAAHAAAISAGDKSATSKPVSTASDDDAVMTVPATDATRADDATTAEGGSAAQSSPSESPKKSGTRRSGRVKPRAERLAAAEAAANETTTNEGTVDETAGRGAEAASAETSVTETSSSSAPSTAATGRRRGSRRAATSTGAPSRAGDAAVMTVPAGSSQPTASQATQTQEASASQNDTDVSSAAASTSAASASATSTGTASSHATTKRPRRRAGSSAGAPVALQPVDLSAPAATSAPLTTVAGESAGSTSQPTSNDEASATAQPEAHGSSAASDVGSGSETPKASARKKRARVSSPAGAPSASTES